jgi:Ca2+-transporting ATPase
LEENFVFVGLQAMIDPPRVEVKDSIQICKNAGIRVVMITGDNVTTAKAIAEQLGID